MEAGWGDHLCGQRPLPAHRPWHLEHPGHGGLPLRALLLQCQQHPRLEGVAPAEPGLARGLCGAGCCFPDLRLHAGAGVFLRVGDSAAHLSAIKTEDPRAGLEVAEHLRQWCHVPGLHPGPGGHRTLELRSRTPCDHDPAHHPACLRDAGHAADAGQPPVPDGGASSAHRQVWPSSAHALAHHPRRGALGFHGMRAHHKGHLSDASKRVRWACRPHRCHWGNLCPMPGPAHGHHHPLGCRRCALPAPPAAGMARGAGAAPACGRAPLGRGSREGCGAGPARASANRGRSRGKGAGREAGGAVDAAAGRPERRRAQEKAEAARRAATTRQPLGSQGPVGTASQRGTERGGGRSAASGSRSESPGGWDSHYLAERRPGGRCRRGDRAGVGDDPPVPAQPLVGTGQQRPARRHPGRVPRAAALPAGGVPFPRGAGLLQLLPGPGQPRRPGGGGGLRRPRQPPGQPLPAAAGATGVREPQRGQAEPHHAPGLPAGAGGARPLLPPEAGHLQPQHRPDAPLHPALLPQAVGGRRGRIRRRSRSDEHRHVPDRDGGGRVPAAQFLHLLFLLFAGRRRGLGQAGQQRLRGQRGRHRQQDRAGDGPGQEPPDVRGEGGGGDPEGADQGAGGEELPAGA
ncbi:hypothetical protein lerEdw1_009136 [Lerista edwardsae]|nr:hypothetical protein lerEdw1_009136 [Lerista edwardsae]